MRAKSLLLLIIALGCGTVASVGVSQVMMDQKNKGSAEPPTVEIFVAVKDVDVNQKLTPELVKLEKWPQNRVPEGAIFKLEDVADRYVRQRMYPGEPVLVGKLNDTIVGVDTEIPRGYRVFDLPVNERNGGSGYIKPGARVDVMGTFKVNNVYESRTVMRNVRIFGINGVTVRDSDPTANSRATTFQLLVKESQMEALNLAAAMGELRCTLRGTLEDQDTPDGTDTGEEFITWVRGTSSTNALAAPATSSMTNLAGSAASEMLSVVAAAALPPATEEKKKELLIITPNGVTKYQWSKDDELPQRVDADGQVSVAAAPAAGWPGSSSSGAFSGTGGYTPTYPTSAPSGGSRPSEPMSDAGSAGESDPATPGQPTNDTSDTKSGKPGGSKSTARPPRAGA
ncbi:MAG: Flp pilus assembly protein CpaB [Aureliella sp.]